MPFTYDSVVIFIGVALLGLALGSFSSALAYRLPRGKTWRAVIGSESRSYCPHCGTRLTVRDLIPLVSWFSARGKCRYCNAKIGKRYVIFEFTSFAICLAIYASYGLSLPALLAIASLPFLLALGSYGNNIHSAPPLSLFVYPALFGALFQNDRYASHRGDLAFTSFASPDTIGAYVIAVVSYTAVCLLFAYFNNVSQESREMNFSFATFGAMSGLWFELYMLPLFFLVMFVAHLVICLAKGTAWIQRGGGCSVLWPVVIASFYCTFFVQANFSFIIFLFKF